MVVLVWLLASQLTVQSVPITTNVESCPFRSVLDTTLCDKVCQWLAAGRWFSPVSSTNTTDWNDITEILLKVELNTVILANNTKQIRSKWRDCKAEYSTNLEIKRCISHQQARLLKIIIGYNKVALLWHENAGTCMHLKRIKSAKTINRAENHWIFYLNFCIVNAFIVCWNSCCFCIGYTPQKDRKCIGQTIKYKQTNNDQQHITQKSKDWATRFPLTTRDELWCYWMVQASNFCSTRITKSNDKLWKRIWFDLIWSLVFNATFSNISAISWRQVLVVEEAGIFGENHRTWARNW